MTAFALESATCRRDYSWLLGVKRPLHSKVSIDNLVPEGLMPSNKWNRQATHERVLWLEGNIWIVSRHNIDDATSLDLYRDTFGWWCYHEKKGTVHQKHWHRHRSTADIGLWGTLSRRLDTWMCAWVPEKLWVHGHWTGLLWSPILTAHTDIRQAVQIPIWIRRQRSYWTPKNHLRSPL